MHVGTLLTRNIAHADPCGQNIENNYVKASATPNDRVKLPNQRRSHFSVEKYVKEGKQNLQGERNEVRADERQTGSGKF